MYKNGVNNRGMIGLAALAAGAILVGAIGAIMWWNSFHENGDDTVADTNNATQTDEELVEILTPNLNTVKEALDAPVTDCEDILDEIGLAQQIDCLKEAIVVDAEAKPIYDPEPCDRGILLRHDETGIIRCLDEDESENMSIEEVDVTPVELELIKNEVDEFIPTDNDPEDIWANIVDKST